MKTWRWFQSRVVNVSVAALLALPMGTPSVFAASALQTDQLRPSATSQTGAAQDVQVGLWQTEARARAADLPTLLVDAVTETLKAKAPVQGDAAGSPISVFALLHTHVEGQLTKANIAQAVDRSITTIEPDLTALKGWNLLEINGIGDNATYGLTVEAHARSQSLAALLRGLPHARLTKTERDALAPQINRVLKQAPTREDERASRGRFISGMISDMLDEDLDFGSPAYVFNLLLEVIAPITKLHIAAIADRDVTTIEPDLTALKRWGLLTVEGRGNTALYGLTEEARERADKLLPVIQTVKASRDRAKWDEIAPTIAAILAEPKKEEARRTHLRTVAAQMVPATGGILAADEGAGKPEADGVIRKLGTAGKRLASVGLPETPENRQAMRRVLLTTPGLKQVGIDAVILDRDTLTNTTPDGQASLVAYLQAQGIIPGLKTDEGLEDDPAYPEEKGVKRPKDRELTKLPALLARATELGLGFTKYRTTIRANDPPEANLRDNAQVQARQAKLAQEAGLVPIVEPEVIFDGSDGSPATHDLAASYATTTHVLDTTFEELQNAGVWLPGVVLKTSMILAGKKAAAQTDPETVGFETLKGLLKTVPAAVPAIVFLSGGQADDQATANLDAVARASQTRFTEARDAAVAELRAEGQTTRAEAVAALTAAPWQLSYSFGRGLQAKPLAAWGGKDDQIAQAQAAMHATAQEVQRARQGRLRGTPEPNDVIGLASTGDGTLWLQSSEVVEAAKALLISPDEAASDVDGDHRWVVVDAAVYEAEDATIMQEWLDQQLQYTRGDAESALHFLTVSAGEDLESALAATSSVPGSRIASAVSPNAPFVQAVKAKMPGQQAVAGIIGSGASAIRTAVAAALNEGRPNPVIAKQLELSEEEGLLIPKALAVAPETKAVIRAHQEKLRMIRSASEKA